METLQEKSRKERRKEARLAKKKERLSSWIHHQKSIKEKKILSNSKPPAVENPEKNPVLVPSEEGNLNEGVDDKSMKKSKSKLLSEFASSVAPMAKGKKSLKRTLAKTKFEEYLEMETKRGVVSAEEDLEMERKLAKKLKLKGGKLRGVDDELNLLLEGVPLFLDHVAGDDGTGVAGEDNLVRPSGKKRKKRKKVLDASSRKEDDEGDAAIDEEEAEGAEVVNGAAEIAVEEPVSEVHTSDVKAKYIAPHLRSHGGSESEECLQIRRRVRGLLNRLSETNVESITGEISTVIQSVGRSAGCQMISDEVLASCLNGPRGNEQYAAIFAAFIAGMGCLVGIDFSAKLLASLAKSFEEKYSKADGLSSRNLTLLLSYLCIFGVCSSDLIYDFLSVLSKRLEELDVSTILTILQCCGMKLRGDDPTAMKDFMLDVQNKVNELKSLSGSVPDGQVINSKRMEFMLETIFDIKNNKTRSKEDPAPLTRLKKWLRKLHVEDVLLRGLKWSVLLDPEKKGQWWLSGNITSTMDDVVDVSNTIDLESLEAQKLLNIAAAQRMNTVSRKAIFCIIMSGEDYIDAFEKILRLDLHGNQDREIIRVLVECCLQEKMFNKYYTALASKLCSHKKNHKVTLKYCIWDHFKELESMGLSRSMNLARFVAEMLASFSLSLSVLVSVDLSDLKQLTPKRVMHFRMLFEFIFEKPDALVWNIFTRIAAVPELEPLGNGLEFFIKHYVANACESAAAKFRIAKKALNNMAGVLR